jgi:ABC-type proline/glycine betaine transport system substrate-binding protein
LIAVVAAAVIVSIFVFSTFYPPNFNRANPANQTSVQKLSFNLQEGTAQANVLAQNLTDKTGFIAVSATSIQRTNRPSSPILERANP